MKWYVSYRSGPIGPYSNPPKIALLYNSISTNIIDFFVISKCTALGLLLESLKSPVGNPTGLFVSSLPRPYHQHENGTLQKVALPHKSNLLKMFFACFTKILKFQSAVFPNNLKVYTLKNHPGGPTVPSGPSAGPMGMKNLRKRGYRPCNRTGRNHPGLDLFPAGNDSVSGYGPLPVYGRTDGSHPERRRTVPGGKGPDAAGQPGREPVRRAARRRHDRQGRSLHRECRTERRLDDAGAEMDSYGRVWPWPSMSHL